MTKIHAHQFCEAQTWARREIPTRYSTYWLHQEMKRQRAIRRGLDAVIASRASVHHKVTSLQTVLGMLKEAK